VNQADAPVSDTLERVLVLVKGEHESRLTLELLARGGFHGVACRSVPELCSAMEEGVGVVLLVEELLTSSALEQLERVLRRQPPWSDYPIVVFSAQSGSTPLGPKSVSLRGNVTFLDRPVRVRTMLASIHAALGSRRRQYEARRAIESRDEFLAMLAHELRNPLGAISLAIATLERQEPAIARSRAHAVIDRQTRHLARLVDDLLDVARITSGKIALKSEKVNLVDVVQAAFAALDGRAREHGLSYQLRVADATISLQGDRQRLEQVFANLLTNAIKYTPRGGSVEVEVTTEGEHAVVSVVDSGVGLASEARERIFEPFAQIDTSRERAQGGLGLGLALVRSIVHLHAGTVDVRSEGLGRGSTFRVRLRRLRDAAKTSPRASSEPLEVPRCTIVVVEDNPDIRDLLVGLLEGSGHEVIGAEDGPSGLEKLLSLAPDIAFVDVGLPGFDGLELARRARASGSATHLVALTGYGQEGDRQESRVAGFDSHLVKPVGGAELERAILGAAGRFTRARSELDDDLSAAPV
jgi:signal transduction histidine kinase/ActR/RegA family two-component response regulator